MALLGIGLLLFGVLITPISLRLTVAVSQQATGAMVIRIWGMPIVLVGGIQRNMDGKLVLLFHREGSGNDHEGDPGSAITMMRQGLKFIKTANVARAYLKWSIHIEDLGCQVRVGTKDAAKTALLAAGLQVVLNQTGKLLGNIRHCFQVQTDFSGQGSAGQAHCILFARLGNLLLGSGLAFAAYKRAGKQIKEEATWNTPSAI